jgi:excisionase family DNA binding protein
MFPVETPAGRLFCTPAEVADALGVDARTVRRAAADGQIPSIRAGVRILIPVSWLKQQARLGGDDDAA